MKKIKRLIPLSKVCVDREIKESVGRALKSGQYILGKECKAFEEEFADYTGTRFAVLTGSGTAALWLTLIALGITSKDEIIVPSLTAFPTIEPILALGAKPVFIDIDSTYTIDTSKIEDKITPKTKGIIPVHLYGHPANMSEIQRIADKHKLFILEDCCQAHGAQFRNKRVGSIGIAGCFSFYPSKNLTVCGDGGAVATNDAGIAKMLRMLRNHGRSSKYIHSVLGYNERFNEIQAAIGRCSLKRLSVFNSRRREIADIYLKNLRGFPLILPYEQEWAYHVWHMFVVRVKGRDRLRNYLLSQDIETGIHYPVPCHLQSVLLRLMKKISLPVTETSCREIISLPMHPMLKDADINYVCRQIAEYFQR